ncbi:MAG: ABC transporter ATP-binding protein [Verrucomicrobiota bacterium]
MSHLVIENLSHRYPGTDTSALDNVSLEVESCEILALVGGSGSGKSTLLRAIAGLEKPTNGTISLGATTLTGPDQLIPPEKRQIGMVSQSGDLFPHLTILRNTAYGLRRFPKSERRQRALDALELVGLATYADRYPSELSGGEAQRAALARSLAFEPSLLLLDEPFSNLDASLRERLRTQTVDLLRNKNTTAIFVTHHGDDALAVGDRLAVLRDGKLIQVDEPRRVLERPADTGVSALFGINNSGSAATREDTTTGNVGSEEA